MQSPSMMNGDRNHDRDRDRDRGDRDRDRDRTGRGPSSMASSAPSLAQQIMANMPALVPRGRLDPLLQTGIVRDLDQHYRRLRDEEERLRVELETKQERLRKQLRSWDKMEREARGFELRSELSEKSLKTISGEGMSGAAF